MLKNPISLFSFRFPPVERGASSDGGIKEEGEEEVYLCSRPPVSGGEIRSDRYVYS